MPRTRDLRRMGLAAVFLGPNIIGFFTFTFGPLVMSLVFAFTNWDLRRHNMFHPAEHLKFVGLQNFIRLLQEPNFWRFLGNTLVLMLGLPFSIAGALGIALLLSRDLNAGGRRITGALLATAMAAIAVGAAVLIGAGASSMTLLIASLFALSILLGVTLGSSVYRTLLYLPSFTSGVATILLWKNLFNPTTGPINRALTPILDWVNAVAVLAPASLFHLSIWFTSAAALILMFVSVRQSTRGWADGDVGSAALGVAVMVAVVPAALFAYWSADVVGNVVLISAIAVAIAAAWPVRLGRAFACPTDEALGGTMLISAIYGSIQLAMLMLGLVLSRLPAWAAVGLQPPGWHTNYYWAKPAIMLIGLWASLGSGNMLLYLAGLTGVPEELYEAADIDGATPRQRFWHITWPQLAPTTFFITVMGVIGGLQGGFEVARTLTKGGPDGATTTLSYFIYNEGFVTGRLGYSSAIAWVLIAIVLAVTAFNWRFGGRYVNN